MSDAVLPGSQLCSGHERGKSGICPCGKTEAQESLPRPQLQGPSGGRRTRDPNKKMQKGAFSSELSRETTADQLSICQQVPQISTSVGEGDVLLFPKEGAGHPETSV